MRLHGVPPPKPANQSLGERLREVRKHHKMLQPDMAEVLNISRSSYQHYERDERDMPVSLVRTFVQHFNLDAEWFLFGNAGRSEIPNKGADK